MVMKLGDGCGSAEVGSKERLIPAEPEPVLGYNEGEGGGASSKCLCCSPIRDAITKLWETVQEKVLRLWRFGRSDPRKIIFAAKMAFALVLISLLVFLKEPFEYLGQYSVWAILTVVLVFEFSIGATLSRGFNRGIGTISAGGLALLTAEISILFGLWQELFLIISIFLVGFGSTFAKLYPGLKQYEYGIRVFLLTYIFISVSGFTMIDFLQAAVTRFVLIAIGAVVALVVNICIYPIWAGEDLHNKVVKNFMAVATSLEGCVNEYLQCIDYETVTSKVRTYQASDDPLYRGYMSVIESTSQEEALEGFASWEPPHGPYKMFKYPWKNFLKVSGALRHCSFTVMALHGCILSEIQAPPEWRHVFSNELQKVGNEGVKVLRELGNKVKKMERLSSEDILLKVHEEAEELQHKIDRKLYLLMNLESMETRKLPKDLEDAKDAVNVIKMENDSLEIKSLRESMYVRSNPLSRSLNDHSQNTNLRGAAPSSDHFSSRAMFRKQISWPARFTFSSNIVRSEDRLRAHESSSALSLSTFASLLIEFVARLQNLVHTFEELADKAKFKEPIVDDAPSEAEVAGFWNRFSRFFR